MNLTHLFFTFCGKTTQSKNKLMDLDFCKNTYQSVRFHQTDPRIMLADNPLRMQFMGTRKLRTKVIYRKIKAMTVEYSKIIINLENNSNLKNSLTELYKKYGLIDLMKSNITFSVVNLESLPKSSTYWINKDIKCIKLLNKQFKKSIFTENPDKFISIVDKLGEDRKTNILLAGKVEDMDGNKDVKLPEHWWTGSALDMLRMNLYIVLRMCIKKWSNKDGRLSKNCVKNSEYPENIIGFFGRDHSEWIIAFFELYFNKKAYKHDSNFDRCVNLKF